MAAHPSDGQAIKFLRVHKDRRSGATLVGEAFLNQCGLVGEELLTERLAGGRALFSTSGGALKLAALDEKTTPNDFVDELRGGLGERFSRLDALVEQRVPAKLAANPEVVDVLDEARDRPFEDQVVTIVSEVTRGRE